MARSSGRPQFAVAAVIIDLDGTLLDTAGELAAAANAMLADLGEAPLPEDLISTYVGKGAERLVHRVLTRSMDGQADAERAAHGMARFLLRYEKINGTTAKVYPGVHTGLAAMRARGLRLACVTNKPKAFAQPLLDRSGLAASFELVLGGDSLPRRKPDPMLMLAAAEHFGLPPAQVLAIGDSLNDALAARAAGMPVVAVPYGYNEGKPVESLDVDAVVRDLDDACSLIDLVG